MKKIIVLLVCAFFSFGIKAQSFIGAWERIHSSKSPLKNSQLLKNGLIPFLYLSANVAKHAQT